MKTLYSLLLIMALVVTVTKAQSHIETRMTIKNESGKIFTLVFGLDTAATEAIDEKLGEIAAPSSHPNDGLHCAFVVLDAGDRVFSYKDFRPFRSQQVYIIEHEISIAPPGIVRGHQLNFSWAYPLQANIDSIVVIDYFDGLIAKFKFSNDGSVNLSGNAGDLERFKVRVYYNFTPVSVTEEVTDNSVKLYPQPVEGNLLYVASSDEYSNFVVLNLQGETMLSGATQRSIDVSSLASGVYQLRLEKKQGYVIKRFIKL